MSRLYVDIRNILNLDISIKSPVKAGAMGRYKSVFKGKGIEFDGFRAYSENDDDASLIDWKASIRANEMLIREFVEERNMNIFFLVAHIFLGTLGIIFLTAYLLSIFKKEADFKWLKINE